MDRSVGFTFDLLSALMAIFLSRTIFHTDEANNKKFYNLLCMVQKTDLLASLFWSNAACLQGPGELVQQELIAAEVSNDVVRQRHAPGRSLG